MLFARLPLTVALTLPLKLAPKLALTKTAASPVSRALFRQLLSYALFFAGPLWQRHSLTYCATQLHTP